MFGGEDLQFMVMYGNVQRCKPDQIIDHIPSVVKDTGDSMT